MKLHLHHVEPRQGKVWAQQGWTAFRRAALPMTSILAAFLMGVLLLSLAGPVGAILGFSLTPLLILVFMLATHQVVQNRPVSFLLWQQPFKVNAVRSRVQVQLALLFGLLVALLLLAVDGVDAQARQQLADAMEAMVDATTPAAQEAAEKNMVQARLNPQLLEGMALRGLLLTLLVLPFWHAAALAHWGGHGLMQSMFGSLLGLWHNKGAYLVHGLIWLGVQFAAGLLLGLVALLAPALAFLLLTPVSLLLGAVFLAGLYFSFADTFRFAIPAPAHEA
jgi:hypothetical protein